MMRQTSLTEEPPAVMESEMDGLAAAEETMPSGNTSKGAHACARAYTHTHRHMQTLALSTVNIHFNG